MVMALAQDIKTKEAKESGIEALHSETTTERLSELRHASCSEVQRRVLFLSREEWKEQGKALLVASCS